ncbi:hypothetical protein Anas_01474 [Armadillidium nasatum]|uniref:Uncharacterized protein n=1 Tax=Armadillidium nasatum TaxID=96803 RepID=A0A5N5TKJ0_9CRUS|nr:hypothetical protein Anas_01474 [Armadillidium nasatum]
MVIGEIMVEESHIYDLEEGEILEDEEGEVINISKNFQNSPCHDIGNNLHHTFHSGTEKYFNLREESRYPEKLYLSSEGSFPNQNFYKYPRIKDISDKVRTSRHSNDYNLKNKSSTFKFRKKSRSRSCSVSSSSSNCSCSSCTSCSTSLSNEKTVQPPSHFSGKSGKEKKDLSHLPKKREAIESVVKAKSRQKECSSSKLTRERSPNKKLKKLPRKDLVVLRTRTNPYRRHLPEKSSKKRVVSRNAKTVKFKSPLRNEKSTRHTVLSKNESLPDAIVDTDLTLPKLIPGSLGEMLLKKQLKGELKKDPILPSEKGVSFYVQGKEGNNIKQFIDSSKSFEIVDLCNENEDESEEDELTLRIKALQSAMKTRGLLGMTKANQREDNSKSSTLEDKNQINPGASSEIDFKLSEEVCESQNLSSILVLESDDERKNLENKECENLNNNNTNLEERDHSSKTLIEYGKIEKHDFDNERTAVEQPENEEVNNHFKSVKDKCEIASTDMDISNDSFGDNLPTQSENNESEIKTVASQDSNTICQNSTFPIPVEWAYMIPPPCNTDVPDDDSLNNIRNWCFNQNMFVQSMQESVSNMNPVESWKSAEANSCGVDCYNSSNTASNFYYQQPLATSETRRVVTYDEYQCDYNSSLAPTVDVTVQSGELRDCHAEQYKSFMSTVIQNNCPQASHKKDQHRDLINIDLKPEKFQNSNLVSVKPDMKLNTVKRRTRKRRRSNRKSVIGNNLPITMKQTQEIDKTEVNVIDDDDEDMLRAMLLNEMSLKNQKVCLDKQNLENNNNNNNNKNSNKSRMNERKLCSTGNERLVKVGKSLEVSFSNQNPKFRKAGLQTKSKWPVERRLGPKGSLKSKSQEAKVSEQKFVNDASLRNFSLSKFPPVKPVIININEDSDTEDEHVKKVETVNNCEELISGIDSFIRSFRNKKTIAQEKIDKTSSIMTPKGVSHLSEEKQQEYRRLKQLMISKRKVLQMKSKKALTSKKLPSSSGDEKDNFGTNVDSVECKPNKHVQEKEQNMDMNLSNKFCSNINDSFESKDVGQSKMVNDSKGGNVVSIHVPESERTVKEHLIEVPITESQILPINKEICNSNSVQNTVVNVHQNLEEVEKKCGKTYQKDESILCSESIDNRNVVNDEPLSTNNSLDYCSVGNEKVLSIGDNLESKDICSSNLQLQVTEEVSELNDCLNESFDTSDESSSSESESSSSSSSSSNDSDTDIEEQTEIDLRNRLLQKRQEFLQKGNDSLSASCGQSPVENRNILLKCEQNIETSSVGSQDEIINSVDSNNHTPLMDSCRENDEVAGLVILQPQKKLEKKRKMNQLII